MVTRRVPPQLSGRQIRTSRCVGAAGMSTDGGATGASGGVLGRVPGRDRPVALRDWPSKPHSREQNRWSLRGGWKVLPHGSHVIAAGRGPIGRTRRALTCEHVTEQNCCLRCLGLNLVSHAGHSVSGTARAAFAQTSEQ